MLARWRHCIRHAPPTLPRTRQISDFRPFQPGDLVLLREKLNRSAPPILTRPLKPGKQVQSHRGIIKHDDLIGKRVRDLVTTQFTSKNGPSEKIGTEFRLHEVKLEEYVRLSRRLVTPVYPADARLIVELLDLHPTSPSAEGEGQRLEILEAGTGHGALTLYLSRAVHGANSHVSKSSTSELQEGAKEDTRRAVIHTLEISAKYSSHAQDVVRGFRRGLYARNVDFHVSDVSDWLSNQLSTRSEVPFLSHAILDLPNSDHHLAQVARALRIDGTLVVFNPSITQITACAAKIREEGIPLELERVVELPTNGEAGGREWKVTAVRPRAAAKADAADLEAVEEDSAEAESGLVEDLASPKRTDEGWQMVCRPKVGDRIVGGGFVGVWKKQRDN